MDTFRLKFSIVCVALALFAVSTAAKRVSPKPVAPVISGGIRYSAAGDGRNEYIVAADASSGNVLWKTKVSHNRIKFWKEEDNQWVFITNLKLTNNVLLIRDEMLRCYSVDLKTKRVKKQPCGNAFSQ